MDTTGIAPLPDSLESYQMIIKVEITDEKEWTSEQLQNAQSNACKHVTNTTGIPSDEVTCANQIKAIYSNTSSPDHRDDFAYLVEVLFHNSDTARMVYEHYSTNTTALWELASKTIVGHSSSGAHTSITFERKSADTPVAVSDDSMARLIIGCVVGGVGVLAGLAVGLAFYIKYRREHSGPAEQVQQVQQADDQIQSPQR